MPWISLHQTWQIYWQIYPTHQSSIDALNTITPNLADLLADLPHPSIKHRCLEYHYTKTWQIYPPSIKHRCLEYITPILADLLADLPPSIKHGCFEYHYTKFSSSTSMIYPTHQSSIDALNTITPNLADPLADLPHPSIKHRCLEYHYTKLGRSTSRSTPPINQA